ncbi:MAG: hypothetical protein E7334_04840 [Clostridiales bacterium]|nr:hypothetical protein [Clostridiales bacterium]
MKAIIMAGGEGSRLRPLTCEKPKPLMPVLGKPVMRYAVELLHKHGIYDIAATIAYRGNLIKEEFSDSVVFFEERMPLGTAGSIKNAKEFLNAPFIVISGDALTDVDLTDAVAFHKNSGALATLILKRVEDPLEYGVVVTDKRGKVKRFVEKPDWRHVLSDNVNTGIYILDNKILDFIPENGAYDFGSQLFPKLAEEGQPIYGYVTDSYWCDIGDASSYISCQQDMLFGKVKLNYARKNKGTAVIDNSAQVEGPCYIGSGSYVDKDAQIFAGSVIGDNVYIGRGARIKGAVIWNGAHIGENAVIERSVIMENARVKSNANVMEGACIGSNAVLGLNSTVRPYVNIWPEQYIFDDAVVHRSVIDSNAIMLKNDLGVFTCALMPEEAAALGAALVSVSQSDNICVGYDKVGAQSMLADAFIAGAMSMGALLRRAGNASLPAVMYTGRAMGADACAYFSKRGCDIELRLFIGGTEMELAQMRKLMKAYSRLDNARCVYENIRAPLCDMSAQPVYDAWKSSFVKKDDFHILYDTQDESLVLYDVYGQPLSDITVSSILDDACGYIDGDKGIVRIMVKYDPELAASVIARFMHDSGQSMKALILKHNRCIERQFVDCPQKARGKAMRLISEKLENADMSAEGIEYSSKNGMVNIRPSNIKGRIELITSASNQEFARELMADCEKVVKAITDELKK